VQSEEHVEEQEGKEEGEEAYQPLRFCSKSKT
jgi:hypothetical protein